MSACATCNADNMEELEAIGQLALGDEISWREAARRAGLSHHHGLKTHMEKHWAKAPAQVDVALAEMDETLAETMRELKEQMSFAPPEVKPLYAIAIRNLRGLLETKPSQQNLVAALKAIHEITGMKMEQRLMLGFANRMFGTLPNEAKAAIDSGVIDAESEET